MPKVPLPITQSPTPKVAITADWIIGGGAEQVVMELHKIYPDAPIYTSYCSDEWREKLDNKVVTGYLQHFEKLRKYLPLLQYYWFRSIKLDDYDIVISSSGNGMSKAIKTTGDAKHICYCHTPVHYLWRHYDEYLKRPGFGIFNPIARFGLKILVKPLQKLDYKAAQKVDQFIANSTHIQNDIKKYYNRDATIIFPPVDTDRFDKSATARTPLPITHYPAPKRRSGFVTVGRLVPMKKTDFIIEACNKLGVPLTVIGTGPELEKLKNIARPNIRFLGKASNEVVASEISQAKGFLFASFDDFGITPVEAIAAGTPVIAYKRGGALDYITDETGVFFESQTTEDIAEAIEKFNQKSWDHAKISKFAQKFNKETFHKNITSLIKSQTK